MASVIWFIFQVVKLLKTLPTCYVHKHGCHDGGGQVVFNENTRIVNKELLPINFQVVRAQVSSLVVIYEDS